MTAPVLPGIVLEFYLRCQAQNSDEFRSIIDPFISSALERLRWSGMYLQGPLGPLSQAGSV